MANLTVRIRPLNPISGAVSGDTIVNVTLTGIGAKGDKGDVGPQGEVGPAGPIGPVGPAGPLGQKDLPEPLDQLDLPVPSGHKASPAIKVPSVLSALKGWLVRKVLRGQ